MMRFFSRRVGPWGWGLLLLRALAATRRHIRLTPRSDRERLRQLVKLSGGRPGNLSSAERRELVGIVKNLRLHTLVRELVTTVARPGRAARRNR